MISLEIVFADVDIVSEIHRRFAEWREHHYLDKLHFRKRKFDILMRNSLTKFLKILYKIITGIIDFRY